MTQNHENHPDGKYILYAEDDVDDRLVFQTLLHQLSPELGSIVVDNGLRAVEYLHSIPENGSLPCFILLDINMPVMNGFAALKAIKHDSRWSSLPVIMYTTSNYLPELANAQLHGAEKIITKPFSMEDIRKVITDFANFCIQLPELRK